MIVMKDSLMHRSSPPLHAMPPSPTSAACHALQLKGNGGRATYRSVSSEATVCIDTFSQKRSERDSKRETYLSDGEMAPESVRQPPMFSRAVCRHQKVSGVFESNEKLTKTISECHQKASES